MRTPVLLFIALIAGPAFADSDAIQFVRSYAGPHPAEFQSLLSEVQTVIPSALAYITGQWGLPNMLHTPLLVRVTDDPNTIPGRPVAAYVRAFHAGDVLRQELVVDLIHHQMYPTENVDTILYHEVAHVVLQDAVSSPVTQTIPQWFNEGLAQSVTSEGHDRTDEAFKQYGHTEGSNPQAVLCDLNGHIDEFYHGEYNFGCYTYFYLAVQRFLQLGGRDALPTVLSELRQGRALPTAIQETTHLDWPGFQANVQQYVLDLFAGKQPEP